MKKIIYIFSSITIIVILILFMKSFTQLNINLSSANKKIIQLQNENQIIHEQIQYLKNGMDIDKKRHNLLLYIRDIIIKETCYGIQIAPYEAYKIATIIVNTSDKFMNIDPLLIVSIQKIESHFNKDAKSPMNALGINQITKSTGRLLCKSLNWEYSDEILFDIEKSTYLMCFYLNILNEQYHNTELVLAEYNGGPKNAYYFKIGSNDCSNETKMYVKKVLQFRRELKKRININ